MTRILVVDNHDSFVHTIVQYVRRLGARCDVRPCDEVTVHLAAGFDAVLVSPGPGAPGDSAVGVDLVRHCAAQAVPLLGICIGHQAIAAAYGAIVTRAPEPVHGRTSEIIHDGRGVFTGLPNPVTMTRYHSLTVLPETVPPPLEVTAVTRDGLVMGLRHQTALIEGVQFHPESVISEHGAELLRNWLTMIGDGSASDRTTKVPAPGEFV